MDTFRHLATASTSVVVDVSDGVPTLVHWGAALPADADLAVVAAALRRPIPHGSLDREAPVRLVPEHGEGWPGRPGLTGHRPDGTGWAPRFEHRRTVVTDRGLRVETEDPVAGLALAMLIELGDVLRVQADLTNTGSTPYVLHGLSVTLPVPAAATELLSFQGRWCRELQPRRTAWDGLAVLAENRRGRTSHEHAPLMFTGSAGFGEWQGEVWGVHLAWSGNHTMVAEQLADGRRYLQVGELLQPGEISLDPGSTYSTPEVLATYSAGGLTPASWGFHRHLRARPGYATRPRPVLLNTWEAVYFDHDTDRLRELATVAASVGVERFVLDDGWFGSRRDDTSGLGDWWVSSDVYPDGLSPLIDHVRASGMEFGLWVEPEMVNPDSDLYRAHPEWVLASPGYEPVLGRHQLVLDLARPDAFAHVIGALDALLRDHDIAYLKWDMNRDHVQAAGADGRAGTHAQTLALYRLLDELRSRHPGVEIESCSSGGARIDHEILRRTERVWTSDCNDALERLVIQRGASMFIPPEVMGAHIGPKRAHTTGRRHDLGFRAAVALFGHLGIEWNLLELRPDERADLAAVIALHRRLRALLHGGDVVRFDHPDSSGLAHGVYSPDRTEAVVSYAQLTTPASLTPPPLRLPGLDPRRGYEISLLDLPGGVRGPARSQPAWLTAGTATTGGIKLTGAQLAAHGLQLPILWPEQAVLFHLRATEA